MREKQEPHEGSFQRFDRTASSYELHEVMHEDGASQDGRMQHGQRRSERGGDGGIATALPDTAAGRHYQPTPLRDPDQLVNSGIAWFSIMLGVTQIVAPDVLARLIGVRPSANTRTIMRAIGARAVATGFGLLSHTKSTPWLWTRFAGDVVDLSMLGTGIGRRADDRQRAARAALAVGGVAALDFYAASRNQRTERARLEANGFASPEETVSGPLTYDNAAARGGGAEAATPNGLRGVLGDDAFAATMAGSKKVRHAVTINRSAQELYEFWHDFENLPKFMRHLDQVTTQEGGRSHWVTRGPGGAKVEWDAEIVADVPNELIAWQSLPHADVRNAGTVRFIPVPGGRGTEVHVELDDMLPGGSLGAAVAKLFRSDPRHQVRDDLKAFKSVMEAGEILYANIAEKQQAERDDFRRAKSDAEMGEVRG